MVHVAELEMVEDELLPTWHLDTSVGTIPHDSRLKKFGGPTAQIKVMSKGKSFTADVMVCTDSVCAYCKSLYAGESGTKTTLRAANAAAHSPKIDVDASPYLLDGESRARPFVHSVRDTMATDMGTKYHPRGPFDDFSRALEPALLLFDNGELKPVCKGGKSKGLRLASVCVPSECPTCRVWSGGALDEEAEGWHM